MATKRKPGRKPAAPAFQRKPAPPPDIIRPAGGVRSTPVKAPRKSRRQADLQLAEDYRIMRTTPHGERVIADLLLMCGVLNDDESNEPVAVGRLLGRRSVGLHITKMLGLRPEHFPEEAWRMSAAVEEMMGL